VCKTFIWHRSFAVKGSLFSLPFIDKIKMQNLHIYKILLPVAMMFFISGSALNAQNFTDTTGLLYYLKKEFNTGIVFSVKPEREELRTDNSRNFEKLVRSDLSFSWANQNWYYLPFRQEQWNFSVEAGPFFGKGELIDSASQIIDASHRLMGLKGSANAGYLRRFYFDHKNYTLVSLKGWGRYEFYRQSAEGLVTDSAQITLPYDETTESSKLRYGFKARAGWGIGRINPINHYMTAAWLLEKYYPGRNFSEEEFRLVARETGRIKHQRIVQAGHAADQEVEQLVNYLRNRLFLEAPSGEILSDWERTEFRPRLQGTRVEFGPFFNYFNREPDFVYGGYIQFENEKYCNINWNRKFLAGLSYNSYKTHDWLLLETVLGWSWYPAIHNELGFGVKYIPGMVVSGLDDLQPVRHNIIPYTEYYSQLSSKYRIEISFAYRIAPNDRFMLPGPELSVSVYKSSY
jgi:hypothetical protein